MSANTDYLFATTSVSYITSSLFLGDLTVSRRALRFTYSTMTITGNTMSNFWSDTTDAVGSAIYSLHSNTAVDSCTFANNMATNGAAIYFDCSDETLCIYSIKNSIFNNNTATNNGASF